MSQLQLPGRLGKPEPDVCRRPARGCPDRRGDGDDGARAGGGYAPTSTRTTKTALAYCTEWESAGSVAHPLMWEAMPAFDDVESSTQTIDGVDGNPITLYIDRPKDQSGPLPGMVPHPRRGHGAHARRRSDVRALAQERRAARHGGGGGRVPQRRGRAGQTIRSRPGSMIAPRPPNG